jgi:hypothetical protein
LLESRDSPYYFGDRKMAKPKTSQKRKQPGPEPEVLKIEGDWKEAVKKALRVKKPAGGWPKPASKPEKD